MLQTYQLWVFVLLFGFASALQGTLLLSAILPSNFCPSIFLIALFEISQDLKSDVMKQSASNPAKNIGWNMMITATTWAWCHQTGPVLKNTAGVEALIWPLSPPMLQMSSSWVSWAKRAAPHFGLEGLTRGRRVVGGGQTVALGSSPTGKGINPAIMKDKIVFVTAVQQC